MHMRMGVGFTCWVGWRVTMRMIFVMQMRMRVRLRRVNVLMFVAFCQMQPHPHGHECARDGELHGDRFAKHNNRDSTS